VKDYEAAHGNENYLRWLEEMWEVQKFDLQGSTEREEQKKEEILEMLRGLAHLSRRRVEPPDFPSY
jgi:hypothetical protein